MAKLQGGTRIYGTANVDTSVYVGTSNNTTGTGGVLANVTTVFIGNNTINTFINTTGLSINAVTIANTLGVYTGIVNGSTISVGTSFTANSTVVNAISYTISATFIANTLGAYHTGTINAASHTVGTSTVANSIGVYTGIVNGSSLSIGSGAFTANSTQANLVGIPLSANGSNGTAGYVLTSNGNSGSPYWTSVIGVNTAAQYTWTNTQTFSNTVTFSGTVSLGSANVSANGALGTAGQVLTTNGSATYWSSAGSGTFTGGTVSGATTFSANLTIASTSELIIANGAGIQANGSFGTAGDVLTSNGTATYWAAASGGGGISSSNNVVQGNLSADQTVTADTDTVIQFQDDFDPNNWWNASTYRFTPTIAGYYEVTLHVWWEAPSSNTNQYNSQIRKNGSGYSISQSPKLTTSGVSQEQTRIVYLNGSTDYLDYTAYSGGSTQKILSGAGSWFSAALFSSGGGGSFSNGTSVAVSNLAFTNSGGGSVGVAYSFINTVSNSIDTVFA